MAKFTKGDPVAGDTDYCTLEVKFPAKVEEADRARHEPESPKLRRTPATSCSSFDKSRSFSTRMYLTVIILLLLLVILLTQAWIAFILHGRASALESPQTAAFIDNSQAEPTTATSKNGSMSLLLARLIETSRSVENYLESMAQTYELRLRNLETQLATRMSTHYANLEDRIAAAQQEMMNHSQRLSNISYGLDAQALMMRNLVERRELTDSSRSSADNADSCAATINSLSNHHVQIHQMLGNLTAAMEKLDTSRLNGSSSQSANPVEIAEEADQRHCPGLFNINGTESCYYILRDRWSWQYYAEFCQGIGGYLAKVDSQAENEFIKMESAKASLENVWIGLHLTFDYDDDDDDGHWRWLQSEQTPEYNGWAAGEPKHGQGYGGKPDYDQRERCVQMKEVQVSAGGNWYDENCDMVEAAVCEHPYQSGTK